MCRPGRDPHAVPRKHERATEEVEPEQRIPLRRRHARTGGTLITELIENDYITGQTAAIDGGRRADRLADLRW
jgi:hypothetical protein